MSPPAAAAPLPLALAAPPPWQSAAAQAGAQAPEVMVIDDETADASGQAPLQSQQAAPAGPAATEQPLGMGASQTAQKTECMTAFGKAAQGCMSRTRDTPYGTTMEDGAAALAEAERVLAMPDLPGGVLVKLEPASA